MNIPRMNYLTITRIIICLSIFSFASCINKTKDTNNSQPAQAADSPAMNADNADLLRVLQGRWQNSQNTQDEIEIEGNHIKHFNTGQLNREGSIETDAGCVISPCNAESAAQEDGWCFIEKAPNMEQCHMVLQCNKDSLQFKSLNDAGTLMSYRKVK